MVRNRNEAVQLIRELEAAANAHDTPRLMGLYADNAVLVSPVWGEVRGREFVEKTWRETFSLFPDWTVKIDDFLVDEDRVIFLGGAGGTDRNGWFGQPPTGEWVQYRAAISLRVEAGKIVRDERIYDLTSLMKRLEKSRLDKELGMAADVQRVLLSRAAHSTGFSEALGDSIPCRTIGGDFFELATLPSGNTAIAVGDVAGKGPASALLASLIQGMLSVEITQEMSPSAVMASLNRHLVRRGLEPRFVTLVYGVLSPDGSFQYANAGHNPPIMLSNGPIQRLAKGGPVLGAFADSSYDEETVYLGSGDALLFFSDGVTEACNDHDEEYGDERLILTGQVERQNAPSAILRAIFASVQEFCNGAPQTDDITAVVIKYRS